MHHILKAVQLKSVHIFLGVTNLGSCKGLMLVTMVSLCYFAQEYAYPCVLCRVVHFRKYEYKAMNRKRDSKR